MLEIKDLHVNYGAVHALNGVSMIVKDGEIVSLIGANGAGKTTTLRTITIEGDAQQLLNDPRVKKAYLGQ